MKILFLLSLLSSLCFGGLPPTTSKDSADSTNITTFNFQFPNFAGTHTGTTFSLGALNLATGVSGNLSVNNLNSGTAASSSTFWRGDGTWATPTGGGTVTSVGLTVPAFLSVSGSPVTGSGTLGVTLSGTALPVANGGTAQTSNITAATATTVSSWDANKNLSSNSFLPSATVTATAAGTTTLVVGSTQLQIFNGSTTQTVLLPVATTLVNGQSFTIMNLSTGSVTVETSGTNSLQVMSSNTELVVTMQNTAGGTGTASWETAYMPAQGTALQIAFGGTGRATIQSSPSGNVWAAWDGNVNFLANAFLPKFTTTVTAAQTITMVVGSTQTQIATGSSTITYKLPTTSVTAGSEFLFENLSTGVATVQSSNASVIQAMASNTQVRCVDLVVTPTTAANWSCTYQPINISAIAASVHLNAATLIVTANAPVIFDTVDFDTNTAYSTTTGLYTVPFAGPYQISATGSISTGAAGIYVQKNSTKFGYLGVATSVVLNGGSYVINCAKGDTLQINSDTSVTFDGGAAPYATSFSIHLVR